LKLLSPKPFSEYSPDEYHGYIRSLNRPRVFTSSKKDQRDLKVRVTRLKKGTLSIVTKRSPLYVTEKEIEKISEKSEIPQSEIYIALMARGFKIYPDHRTAEKAAEITFK
jgi:hypothetical protein